jgi:regulator of protease activity HflC (stomatin/prohibitin superfamily)
MSGYAWLIGIGVVLLILILVSALKVVSQYKKNIVLRLGRFITPIRQPGLNFIIPLIDRMIKVDTRVVTMDVPAQEVITKDNVTIKVNAVVYLRVINADQAVLEVADYRQATSLISQTTLRSVLGASELDELLAHRDKINQTLQEIVDEQTDPWGIKVSAVEVKDVELPESMQRAMAAQAEAERDRRAKIVHAEGEAQAAEKLVEAAKIISSQPIALQLRYLGTLKEIATERTNLVIFPLPLDIITPLLGMGSKGKSQETTT